MIAILTVELLPGQIILMTAPDVVQGSLNVQFSEAAAETSNAEKQAVLVLEVRHPFSAGGVLGQAPSGKQQVFRVLVRQ